MTPISVLIVEDDSVIAQFFTASLSGAGLRPVTVGSATLAQPRYLPTELGGI